MSRHGEARHLSRSPLSRHPLRTEEAYVYRIKRFIFFHDMRHPSSMGEPGVTALLTSLAVDRRVAASTQTQALCAILFLYREVLEDPLPWLADLVRAKRPAHLPAHLPVVLTSEDVRDVIERLRGSVQLITQLLYGSGLRLLECLRLRVKDVDFARHQLLIRDPKAGGIAPRCCRDRSSRRFSRISVACGICTRGISERVGRGVAARGAGSKVP